MRTLYLIIFLTALLSCSNRQIENLDVKNEEFELNSNSFQISAIDTKFPLRLGEINLKDEYNTVQLNDGIVSQIEDVVKEYSSNNVLYDSSQTYKDSYINTIRLHDSLHSIYLILLKHIPTGDLNSRVLFYDNQKKEFINGIFDFNLWALYNYENEKLSPSNLKQLFKINSPEIDLVDFNKDGINDYKFVRLWHNGTFNAIYTTILTIKDNKIDTLHLDEKPIGNEEFHRRPK